MATNELIVVQGHDHPLLLTRSLQAQDASWVAATPPAPASAHTAQDALPPGRLRLHRDARRTTRRSRSNSPQPQWAVTPGQSVVLYDGEVCLGGAVISDR